MSTLLNSAKRLMILSFPRNDGPAATLLVNKMSAQETVSADFTFTLEVFSENAEIPLKDVQCKMVCVELMRDDHSKRFFNGYCFEFALQSIDNGTAVYKMVLKPWLAFLRLRQDHYIFQNQTIAEQTKEIFTDYGMASFELKIREADPKNTFSCQYEESDYNYLHRRWEALGWHYWYEHSKSGHRLMISDYSLSCEPIDGQPNIPYHHDGGFNKGDKISTWSPMREVVSGKVSFASFDFKSPTPVLVTDTSHHKQGDIHKIEVYRYHGLYGYKDSALGTLLAKRKMEQIDSAGKTFAAKGDSRYVQTGRWFRLSKDSLSQSFKGASTDYEFLILSVQHEVDNNLLNSQGSQAKYENSFTCLRRIIRWRPPVGFNSEAVKVPGVDTATVVGPAGEEIYTDKYGRIKIQFHWDRMGKLDEKSSAWVRVMTPWADKNFGMVALPRIGTEVVVQFLQGNPDRPLVVGQLYNQRHMPPWSLPANQTQSGILSRSSKGGTAANANAFRFEDKKGQEEVWLHAEKDQRIEVENDESHWVGHDRTKTIDHDETVHVKHDRTETVDHDEKITVHNDRTERVDHNEKISIGDNRTEDVGKNETISIGDNRTESVGKNETIQIGSNRSVTIGKNKTETVSMAKMESIGLAKMLTIGGMYQTTVGAMMNTSVALAQTEQVGLNKSVIVGKKFHIQVGDELEIEVGKSRLLMRSDGRIEIIGKEILISGSKKVEVHGDDVDLNPEE